MSSILNLNFITSKGTSLAENASFDLLIDKIRPAVFAVSDDKKGEGKGRKGKGRYTKSQDVIFQLFVGRTPLGRFPKKLACVLPLQHNQYVQFL